MRWAKGQLLEKGDGYWLSLLGVTLMTGLL